MFLWFYGFYGDANVAFQLMLIDNEFVYTCVDTDLPTHIMKSHRKPRMIEYI